MRLAVTTIAIACLTAHAVLGCCWSHTLIEQVAAWQQSATADAPVQHGHHHDSLPGHSHLPGDCDGECGGSCNYLLTAKVERPSFDLSLFLTIEVGNIPARSSFECRFGSEFSRLGELIALPLRPHLLHQVLLV